MRYKRNLFNVHYRQIGERLSIVRLNLDGFLEAITRLKKGFRAKVQLVKYRKTQP